MNAMTSLSRRRPYFSVLDQVVRGANAHFTVGLLVTLCSRRAERDLP